MSGIEIAGLVLGAFPLAIEVIKAYSNGMKTIQDIKHYQQILRQFARRLKVEKCKYRNTFIELLSELAGPAKIERMMADLQSDEWNDEDFRSQLKGRMRPADETLDNWLSVAQELNETLRKVIEKFKLPAQDGSSSIQKSTWRTPRTSMSTKFDPSQAWEVGMLGSYRTEIMAEIRQLNADLRELADGGKKVVPGSNSKPNTPINSSIITYHKRIQHHARLLYKTLREKLEAPTCQCGVQHSTHLELRMRRTPPETTSRSQADIHLPDKFLTFSLMFSTQKSGHKLTSMWQEFQLEPISDSAGGQFNLNTKSLATLQITPPTKKIALSPSSKNSSAGHSKSVIVDCSPNRTKLERFSSHLTPPSWKKRKGQGSRTPSPGRPSRSPSPSPVANQNASSLSGSSNQIQKDSLNTPTIFGRSCATLGKKRARFADDVDDESSGNAEVNNVSVHILNSNLPAILCFCTTLATYTTTQHHPDTPPKCVGLLMSDTADLKQEHRVWTPSRILPKPARLLSLAELIIIFTNANTPSRRDRLILGLKLVSSVLQLNTTQWFTEVWEAKDIFFPEADPQGATHTILSRPFVHQSFNVNISTATPPDPRKQAANQARAVIGCNQSLYSLGIVLLEVWYWQTFSSLHSSSALPEILFAYELSDKLLDEAGEQYYMAVRRCIRGLDLPGNDLEDDSFRERVYQDILGPLEANLKTFSGRDFQKIIVEE